MGIDPALRLDEERCLLLDELPTEVTLTFLLNPMHEELAPVLGALKPEVILISGHGRYKDIENVHVMEGHTSDIATTGLIRAAAICGCQLLVLSTCEGARIPPGLILGGDNALLPRDVVSFTYPADSSTILEGLRILARTLLAGNDIADSIRSIRAMDSEDEYAFFNIVHYHASGQPFFRLPGAAAIDPRVERPATRCPGREEDLLALDKIAHTTKATAVIAPAGCEAWQLLLHWQALHSRSPFGHAAILNPAQAANALHELPEQTQWAILDDPELLIDPAGLAGPSVRTMRTFQYRGTDGEDAMPVDAMDLPAAQRLANELLGDGAKTIDGHMLEGVPGFIRNVASGMTPEEATLRFETQNRMLERFAQLGADGRLFASFLLTTNGAARYSDDRAATYFDFLHQLGFDPAVMRRGLELCLESRVVVQLDDHIVLAPEFRLLRNKWFSHWAQDSLRALQILCSVFFMLNAHGTLDIDMGETLLGWAVTSEHWREASSLCVIASGWYGEQGRLPEMESVIKKVAPHAEGMSHVVLTGHIATILSQKGRFAEALAHHAEVEAELRQLPTDDDYFRNMSAILTQQLDCYVELNNIEAAQQKWTDANTVVAAWPDANPEIRTRLVAQHANIHSELGDFVAAAAEMTAAITLAQQHHCPDVLIADLIFSRCDYLRKDGKLNEAERDLRSLEPVDPAGILYPRYLHLKGLLMEDRQDPRWLDHILESYEHDLETNNLGGVIISLLTVARIFIDQGEIDRAKARLKKVFPYIQRAGLESALGTFALLSAEVEMAEGSRDSARDWLAKAEIEFDGNTQSDTRRITRLRALLAVR